MPPRPQTPKPPPEPRAVRVDTWCAMHDVSRTHAYELMKRGVLKYILLGAHRRILLEPPHPENGESEPA
jgi:predicted site-specific integrase-resolvase